jgi:beta-1,4-N-acetylglucosaminyltransferase
MATNTTKNEKMVFVTVGTTRFDQLIEAIDSPQFASALLEKGYTSLVIQAGSSENYHIHNLVPPPATSGSFNNAKQQQSGESSGGVLHVSWFEYAPSLATFLDNASLVISHAGAGSIFETLRRRLPLIAVPNAALMDDHQKELAEKLEKEGYLAAATPDTLVDVVQTLNIERLKEYVPGNGAEIVARVDALCGFNSGDKKMS